MKRNIVLSFIVVLLGFAAFAQDQQKYSALVNEAMALYEGKEYLKSGQKFSEAFVALGNKGMVNDRYNAACSWALAGQVDSAFVQLFKIAQNAGYSNLGHLSTDTDLDVLHKDKRWPEVTALVKANKEKAEANLDKPLVAMLDTIYIDDQKYRMQWEAMEKKYSRDSKEMKEFLRTIEEKDSINLVKVKHILDTRGWLGPDVVGGQGSTTLFLVIQHSDIETQVKYLPMMREAVKNKKAQPSSLALLEDRVALGQGKRQTYGSQIGRDQETGKNYILPLDDPDHVDERRAAVGLGKLQDYVSHWGLTWDPEAYKKELPALEARQKK